jgi:hypothetical protein
MSAARFARYAYARLLELSLQPVFRTTNHG